MADIENRIRTVAETDEASFRRAASQVSDLENKQTALADASNQASRAASTDIDTSNYRQLASSADIAAASARDLESEIQRLNQARLDKLNQEFDTLSRNVGQAGDIQSNLGAISGLAGAAGAAGAGEAVGIAGEVVVLAEELPRLKQAVGALPSVASTAAATLGTTTAALGALGGGLLAFVAALKIAQAQAEASRKNITAAFTADQRRNEILVTSQNLTDEEIQSRIEELEQKRQVIETNLNQANAIEESLNSQNAFIRGAGELSGALGVGNQAFAVTDEQIQTLEGDLGSVNAELDAYRTALNDSSRAAQQAADAEQRLQDQRALRASLDEQILAGFQEAQSAQGLNTKELDERRTQLQNEKQALEEFIETSNLSEDAISDQLQKIQNLDRQIRALSTDEITQAAAEITRVQNAEERRAELIDTVTTKINKVSAATADYNDSLSKINSDLQTEISDLLSDQQQALSDAQQKYNEDVAELESNLTNELADIEDERKEQLQDFFKDRQDATAEHQEKLRQIETSSRQDIISAASRLDAAGVRAARQAREEQTDEAEKQYQEQQEQLDERLQDVQDNLAKEKQEVVESYRSRRQELRQALQQEQRDIRNTYQQRINDARQAAQNERQTLQSGYQKKLNDIRNFNRDSNQLFQQGLENLLSTIDQASGQRQGSGTFANNLLSGASNVIDNLLGGSVTNNRSSTRNSNNTVNVNVNGGDRNLANEIKRTVGSIFGL